MNYFRLKTLILAQTLICFTLPYLNYEHVLCLVISLSDQLYGSPCDAVLHNLIYLTSAFSTLFESHAQLSANLTSSLISLVLHNPTYLCSALSATFLNTTYIITLS